MLSKQHSNHWKPQKIFIRIISCVMAIEQIWSVCIKCLKKRGSQYVNKMNNMHSLKKKKKDRKKENVPSEVHSVALTVHLSMCDHLYCKRVHSKVPRHLSGSLQPVGWMKDLVWIWELLKCQASLLVSLWSAGQSVDIGTERKSTMRAEMRVPF